MNRLPEQPTLGTAHSTATVPSSQHDLEFTIAASCRALGSSDARTSLHMDYKLVLGVFANPVWGLPLTIRTRKPGDPNTAPDRDSPPTESVVVEFLESSLNIWVKQ